MLGRIVLFLSLILLFFGFFLYARGVVSNSDALTVQGLLVFILGLQGYAVYRIEEIAEKCSN